MRVTLNRNLHQLFLNFAISEFRSILKTVQPDTTNLESRHQWTDQSSKALDELNQKLRA